MPETPSTPVLETPSALETKNIRGTVALIGSGRQVVERAMTGHRETMIDTTGSILILPDGTEVAVNSITVGARGSILALLSATEAGGKTVPLPSAPSADTDPTLSALKDTAVSTPARPAEKPAAKPGLRLDVQVPPDVEGDLHSLLMRIQPKKSEDGKKHWSGFLIERSRRLITEVRAQKTPLPAPTHTQSVPGGSIKTGLRRLFGREILRTDIDMTMPSPLASILVRIMENTDAGGANMDQLREAVASVMRQVAAGAIPNSTEKPSAGLMRFATFVLSLKPKDPEEPMGYTDRHKSPQQLIAILSGASEGTNSNGIKVNGQAAQEAALREVQESCLRLARTRVPEHQQAEHDKTIGQLIKTAHTSTAFSKLTAQEQRALESRLGQAAATLDKRGHAPSGQTMQTALREGMAGKKIGNTPSGGKK
jgi:hypothetical protein